ncbi:hypothetical protein C8J56DRAFT_959124 [Mycena floridula]|nr:hypothetical protein C8J56DRAFT_959124 [Mycena floridula]
MKNSISKLGYTTENSAGKIFTTKELGTIPFYRLWNPTVKDHFYTTSATERDSAASGGYTEEGTAGFVYPDDHWIPRISTLPPVQ